MENPFCYLNISKIRDYAKGFQNDEHHFVHVNHDKCLQNLRRGGGVSSGPIL